MDKDKIASICVKQLQTSENFKQPRLKEIQENEDMIAGKVKPALKGRYNVPFDGVIASGFVETLVAQVNQAPKLVFSDPKGSNHKSVQKIQALWERDKGVNNQNWSKQDRLVKRLAAASNIGIFQYIAGKDPKYKGKLSVIDHFDFHCEPNGGNDLEEHIFKGVFNQFETRSQVLELAKSSYYDSTQVAKMTDAYKKTDYKYNEDLYRNKITRMNALGLDLDQNSYVGQTVFNLARWVLNYEGEQYYVVFDYRSGIWLKMQPLEEAFACGRSPWVVWNPVEHAFTLWGKGLFDQIKPVAEAIRINLNEILNNNRKRNWDMKAVDKQMFPDVSKLNWRQDGVVQANVPLGQSIQNGVYHFQTPEISGALNLNQYLNDFLGINTGISDQTKGESSQDTLGIAKINDLQVSKRMKLIGDSYKDAYAKLGYLWDWGIYEHLDEGEALKIIGTQGAEMEKVTKEDTDPDYDVLVVTMDDDLRDTAEDMERKAGAMERISANPALATQLNPKWVAEQELRIGGWKDEEIRRAMDTKNDAYDEIISMANKNIELALKGKELKKFRGATLGYLERIHNFMSENDLKDSVYAKLQQHYDEHLPVADENTARQMQEQAGQPIGQEMEQPVTQGMTTPTQMPNQMM